MLFGCFCPWLWGSGDSQLIHSFSLSLTLTHTHTYNTRTWGYFLRLIWCDSPEKIFPLQRKRRTSWSRRTLIWGIPSQMLWWGLFLRRIPQIHTWINRLLQLHRNAMVKHSIPQTTRYWEHSTENGEQLGILLLFRDIWLITVVKRTLDLVVWLSQVRDLFQALDLELLKCSWNEWCLHSISAWSLSLSTELLTSLCNSKYWADYIPFFQDCLVSQKGTFRPLSQLWWRNRK